MKKLLLVSVAIFAIVISGCAPRTGASVKGAAGAAAAGAASGGLDAFGVGFGSGGPVVYFDFDKYNIKPEAQAVIDAGAGFAKGKTGSVKIAVEGHCDEWGTDEYNQALGLRRANSVKKALVKLGVASKQVSVKSFGESKPVCTDKTPECDAKNRRAELKLDGIPGL